MSLGKEHQLIERLKNGDENAFRKLYHLFYQSCKQWVKKHFDFENALFEDVFQDSMVVLYEGARDGKLDDLSCTIKTYLFAICRNQMLKQFKLQKRQDEKVDEVIIHQREWMEKDDLNQEKVDQVKMIITNTEEPCRSILKLFYYDGKSIDEISVILGYSNKNVVKVQKSRCLGYLKEKVWKT